MFTLKPLFTLLFVWFNLFCSISWAQGIEYLSILQPDHLAAVYSKTKQDFTQGDFGDVKSNGTIIAPAVILANNELLCETGNYNFTGKIVFIPRGSCDFSHKAFEAQKLGAVAVIFVGFDDQIIQMTGGTERDSVKIPVLYINNSFAQKFIQAKLQGLELLLGLGSYVNGLFGVIQGKIKLDTTSDCLADLENKNFSNWRVDFHFPNSTQIQSVFTNNEAYFKKYYVLTNPPKQITAEAKNLGWSICNSIFNLPTNFSDTLDYDFIVQKKLPCSELHAEITASRIRACQPTNFYVKVCNEGTETSKESYVDVTLSNEFEIINFSNLPFLEISNQIYRFQLGDILSNECKLITFSSNLKCTFFPFDQFFCYSAKAFPDTSCQPLSINWSNADIKLSSKCVNNQVEFKLENIGSGDMNYSGEYVLIKDDEIFDSKKFQLKAGKKLLINTLEKAESWHIEATQELYDPNFSILSSTLNNCIIDSLYSKRFLPNFPRPDKGFSYDEECQMARNSYDPNEKEASPLGYGDDHIIDTSTELEYKISFQNTGTDTAYLIKILDPLSKFLDSRSIHSVIASHPYVMQINENDILTFRFDNIYLVDSTTNEKNSHGFVSFKIKQKRDNPIGSFIENKALIYFDLNPPIKTNLTIHKIGELPSSLQTENYNNSQLGFIYPNPLSSKSELSLSNEKFSGAKWNLYNIQGQLLYTGKVLDNKISFPQTNRLNGLYFLEFIDQSNNKISFKIRLF
ncbi:MAG: PA domain-containing protein [Saprospiraceae bacterium]